MNFGHITWLDDKGHMKPPAILYLMLVFLARGWCVFVMSLTQASDRSGLVRLIYPQKEEFLLALASGIGAVIVYLLVIAERKRKPIWLKAGFRLGLVWLWSLLILDAVILTQRLFHAKFLFNWSFGVDALLLFWFGIYLMKSKRLRHYFDDWRE